jgi:hypothetical protein
MPPIPVQGPGFLLTPQTPAALSQAWQVGQLLNARVVAAGNGQVTLQINQQQVTAQSPLPLTPGQTLQLSVERASDPVTLRVVNPSVPADEAIAAQVRAALGRQVDLAPALTRLAQAAGPPAHGASTLLGDAVRLIRELVQNLPTPSAVGQPAGLQHAARDSGVFLEARLAANQPPAPADLKAQLLQIRSAVTERIAGLPGEAPASLTSLLRDVDGLLARVQLNQVASAHAQSQAQPVWVLEIPVRHGDRPDTLRLEIAREDDAAENGRPEAWSVWLNVSPGDLGPLHARVALHGEQISVRLWAERESTATLFRDQMDALGAALRRDGLNTGVLECRSGLPPDRAAIALPVGLLDERA